VELIVSCGRRVEESIRTLISSPLYPKICSFSPKMGYVNAGLNGSEVTSSSPSNISASIGDRTSRQLSHFPRLPRLTDLDIALELRSSQLPSLPLCMMWCWSDKKERNEIRCDATCNLVIFYAFLLHSDDHLSSMMKHYA